MSNEHAVFVALPLQISNFRYIAPRPQSQVQIRACGPSRAVAQRNIMSNRPNFVALLRYQSV